MRNVVHRFALFLVVAVFCRADLTLRYVAKVKAGSAIPAGPAQALEQRLTAGLSPDRSIRIKGDKSLSRLGTLTVIVDASNSTITLLNPATKQYAQTTAAEYIDGLRAKLSPAAAAAMKNLKLDAGTVSTGQSAIISGIRGEEQLTTVTVSMDAPGTPPIPPIRIELHKWLSSPGELDRVPGLRQYAASAQRTLNGSAAEDAVEKLLGQMPGLAEKLHPLLDAARNADRLALKTQEVIYGLAADTKAPVLEITIDLAQISTDAIDDSVFAVPPDFRKSSVAELTRAATPVPPTTPAPPGLRPIPPGRQTPRGAPMLIYKRDPEYTEEARQAKLEGAVMLKIVVGADGVPKNIQVAKSLGLGLDEKAIEAVSQWRFRPAEKNGEPVDFPVTIEVNFRLLARPPQQ